MGRRSPSTAGRAVLAAAAALAIGACALSPAATPARGHPAPAGGKAASVRAHPVATEPDDPAGADAAAARAALGALRLEAAFELRSADPRFGGLSGLLVDPDGGRLVAVGDRGTLWTAGLDHDAGGRLAGVGGWRVDGLRPAPGDPAGSKPDAESLARLDGDDGAVVVAFEQVHRLHRLRLGADGPDAAAPEALPWLDGLLGPTSNEGAEALADLPGGGLLAIAEGRFEPDGALTALRLDGAGGAPVRFGYAHGDGFRPTAADRLGDDVFVLERRLSLLGGFQARVVRLDVADLEPGARLQGETLGVLRAPLPVDNMEGLAARRAEDGRVLLYLISDDNFLALQRTLLLQLSWRPPAPAGG